MARARLKFGVYEERYRPICKTCKKNYPDCRHSKAPERVVLLAGPTNIWMQLNGTNYPGVRFRRFNDFSVVEMVTTEAQFRSKYSYVGRYVTKIERTEELQEKR
jgi:hypothetical protein